VQTSNRPIWVEACFNLANAWKDLGYLDEAARWYRRVLELNPDFAQAHCGLGNVTKDQGKLDEAATCYQRALQLKPDYAEAHNNLGVAYQEAGKMAEAAACYQRALQLQPDLAEAHNNLGNVFRDQGNLDVAVHCHRRALELKPDFAKAHNDLGNTLGVQGNPVEAVICYQRALQIRPEYAEAHNNLGVVYGETGKVAQAVACYQRALQLRPELAEAHNNLGNVLMDAGKVDEALACYRRAVQLKPKFARAHNNLGNALRQQAKPDEAATCYQRALQINPDYADARNNLGNAYRDAGKLSEALACYRRALELQPDFAEAHNNLGNVLKDAGEVNEALTCYRRALQLKPDFAKAHSNVLMMHQYRARMTLSELAAEHAEYGRLRAEPFRASWVPHANDRDPRRRLRLGFVSADFGRHPVGFFLIRALENLDQAQCEVVCYRDRAISDDVAFRFQAAATEWRDIGGLRDEVVAEKIRADRIDILFDLAGHTASNRLLVFARKPAPVQITWIGYEGTTGLEAIDYIVADRHTIPPGQEQWYRERVLRMPDCYVCYDPPETAPAVAPLPAANSDRICFGSFNNLAKITPQVVEVWAKVLLRIPGSRIVFKYRGLDSPRICRRYLDLFTACGIDPSRVELRPPSSYLDYLATYGEVDIALDPFPFGGGITTCDALWMGVPVITCVGETFASRHALSYLASVGLTEMIATTTEGYVELAVSLAGDLPRLSELRAGLRERMAASPLCDGKRFAANLMVVLRDAWRAWCRKEHGENLH
jgi:protein O-GlcNAc transferase